MAKRQLCRARSMRAIAVSARILGHDRTEQRQTGGLAAEQQGAVFERTKRGGEPAPRSPLEARGRKRLSTTMMEATARETVRPAVAEAAPAVATQHEGAEARIGPAQCGEPASRIRCPVGCGAGMAVLSRLIG